MGPGGLGVATTVSILAHELPHGIGDYAVLVGQGMSKWQAIQAQLCTAVGALLGTAVGLLAQTSKEAEEALLSVTAGGFVYLAAVIIMPTLVEAHSSPIQVLLEAVGIATGVMLMVVVAIMEHSE
eukprot:CAMPEP_0113939746 /NCGR_PEP_ID=MMETSP1339-20121228/6013_1 /TAXON_ID=94617 /ORGANISM="Fibrocapsa japonica" /LENGTH=124 /DNA_ID=CAMNT_0000943349 /DNA_START=1 /DNA_END=375 /DNA_ORIENTATION=+ /assembly_acc=CAM_ASM_000762